MLFHYLYSDNVDCGIPIHRLYYVEICHLYPTHSFQDLYNEWILDFVQGLFSIQWGDYMASIFLCNYIYWFTYEPSLQLWKEANLITVDDFFDVFLNLVSKYLLRIFMSMLINFFYIGIECCELSFYNCLVVFFFYFSQFWEFYNFSPWFLASLNFVQWCVLQIPWVCVVLLLISSFNLYG